MYVAIATPEKDYDTRIADYTDMIRGMINEGKLFSIFKCQMKIIRDISAGDNDDELRDYVIYESINVIEMASNNVLKCQTCQEKYLFRHCKNPGEYNEVVHAIELTCDGCGDCYTISEERERVSYFNWNVLKKVDDLRRRSRGFTVKVRFGGLNKPALLYVYNDEERPVLWIDAYQITKADAVQPYWDCAKTFVKQMKVGKVTDEECILEEGAKAYTLIVSSDDVILQVV
jgi:hypothetical protein